MQQGIDFREECDDVHALLKPLSDDDFSLETQFKGWSINDIVAHLHWADYAADLALRDEPAFLEFSAGRVESMKGGQSILDHQREFAEGETGQTLLARWRDLSVALADRFTADDPKRRLKWFGPDMSVRSSATARLMETWSHAQAIYDLLGLERQDTDRIRNVAVIGVNTFGWTFVNRGLDVPENPPHVRLRAPSGETWTWNDESDDNLVEGSATGFCQTVTQCRNVADTDIRTKGETAGEWMEMAQCFAGPPNDPPPPGTRYIQR